MPDAGWDQLRMDILEEIIREEFNNDRYGLQFLRAARAGVLYPVAVPVTWSPVPREVVDCLGRDGARRLCDSVVEAGAGTLRGGREQHKEYCEYAVVLDPGGRPKRVEVTTELRERWLCVARHDPAALRRDAVAVLGADAVPYEELYGVADPGSLSPDVRERAFRARLGGSETYDPREAPSSRLNREHALFMAVPMNGLDDLYYIALLGARRFARADGTTPAPLPWLLLDNPYFRHDPAEKMAGLAHLYGTAADPSVLRAVQVVCWANRTFTVDPLAVGMPAGDFPLDRLVFPRDGLARRWVRWSRPAGNGLHQRLVVGPGDDEPETLADIGVLDPAGRTEPLTGGFQLLELLTVGLVLQVSPPGTVAVPAEALHPRVTTIDDPHGPRLRAELATALGGLR
jgi:hypothetical protein